MRSLLAFIKKDACEQLRTGRLMFVWVLFILFGIMNPAIAKLTPWLLDMMADSLAESGMSITVVSVSAMDSWVQFFKNMPIGLIAFVLLESGILTREYTSGTLVLSLTKGLSRFKVIISKWTVLFVIWSVAFFACFGITYAYNSYFWDNSIAQNLVFSVFCQWLFGVFIISLMILFSVISTSNTGVLLGVGGALLLSYILAIIPKINKYLPTFLCDGNSLIYGSASADAYIASVIITAVASILCFAASIPLFNKKQI